MPEYPIVNPYSSNKPKFNKPDRRSDLELLGDDASQYWNSILNPSYEGKKLNLSGSFNPDVEATWDPTSSLTQFGGPKVNPNFGGNIKGSYNINPNVTLSGGANFGSSVGSSPTGQPFWAGLNIKLQNDGEVNQLVYPDRPGDDADMMAHLNWTLTVKDMIENNPNWNPYQKEIESAKLFKQGRYKNLSFAARNIKTHESLIKPWDYSLTEEDKEFYLPTRDLTREREIKEWENMLKTLEGYPTQYGGEIPKAQFGRRSIMSGDAYGTLPEGSTGVLGDFYEATGIDDATEGIANLVGSTKDFLSGGWESTKDYFSEGWDQIKESVNPYNYVRDESYMEPFTSFLSGEYEKYPSYTGKKNINNKDEAFAQARTDLGAGNYFLYNNKRYLTNLEGEITHKSTQDVYSILDQGVIDGVIPADQVEKIKKLHTNLGQGNIHFGWDADDTPIIDGKSGKDYMDRMHVNSIIHPNTGTLFLQDKIEYYKKNPTALLDDLITEFPHIYQQRQVGRLGMVKRLLNDMINSPGGSEEDKKIVQQWMSENDIPDLSDKIFSESQDYSEGSTGIGGFNWGDITKYLYKGVKGDISKPSKSVQDAFTRIFEVRQGMGYRTKGMMEEEAHNKIEDMYKSHIFQGTPIKYSRGGPVKYQTQGDVSSWMPEYGEIISKNIGLIPSRQGTRDNKLHYGENWAEEMGDVSSHLMRAEQLEDGNWAVFPSLFEDYDEETGESTWVDKDQKDWMPAYNEAIKRGEVINYGEDKEGAIDFSKNYKNYKDILDANLDVDIFAKNYVQSDNFRDMLERSGMKDRKIQEMIDGVMNFDPRKHITYNRDNPSAGTTYDSGTIYPSGEQVMGPGMFSGPQMINYSADAGPPNHPFFDLWSEIAGHEYGHIGPEHLARKSKKALKKLVKDSIKDFFPTYKELKAEGSNLTRGQYRQMKNHMKDIYEVRANLHQLRYQLNKTGIYDSSKGIAIEDYEEGTNPFTDEHLKQMYNSNEDGTYELKPEFENNEILQFIHPQDIKWMMNNIARRKKGEVDIKNMGVEDLRSIGTQQVQRGGNVYQTEGTVEYDKYYDWIKSQEATDKVMKKTPSMILKPDGKTYYMALEDDMYYPYKDLKGKKTIGFGRHNSTVDVDYKSGISIEKANTFLKEDIKNKFSDTKRKYENTYGKDSFDKLNSTEQYMLSDYVYNLGHLFPEFTEAIRSGNIEDALKQYRRYSYQNKGKENEIKKELGRNQNYLEQYLNSWIKSQNEQKLKYGGRVNKYQTTGNVSDESAVTTSPNVTGHYVFNTDESRQMGLEGAPDGTSGTLTWDYKDSRVLEGRQSYPVAIYADGIYQGILEPGKRLITNPAFRIDEIPVGFTPTSEVSNFIMGSQPKKKTNLGREYNTKLSTDDELLYGIFKESFDIKEKDEGENDIQGVFSSGDYKEEEGFDSAKYRKPNHPQFTKDSKYSGIDDNEGGEYNSSGEYEPSATNMKYNSMDMILQSLSSSGAKLSLSPYFQKAAPQPENYEELYSKNTERSGYLNSLRQNAQHGGDVYNQADKELRSLTNKNRELRINFENQNKYESKLNSFGIKKYQGIGQVISNIFGGDKGTITPYNPEDDEIKNYNIQTEKMNQTISSLENDQFTCMDCHKFIGPTAFGNVENQRTPNEYDKLRMQQQGLNWDSYQEANFGNWMLGLSALPAAIYSGSGIGTGVGALGEIATSSPYLGPWIAAFGQDMLGIEGLTLMNMIDAGFFTHGASKIGPDFLEFIKEPSYEGLGDISWDLIETLPLTLKGIQYFKAKGIIPATSEVAASTKIGSKTKPHTTTSTTGDIGNYNYIYGDKTNAMQLKSLHETNPNFIKGLQTQTNKEGLISTKQLNNYINSKNVSAKDKDILLKTYTDLGLQNKKNISLNEFKSAVNNNIVSFETNVIGQQNFSYADYGVKKLGYEHAIQGTWPNNTGMSNRALRNDLSKTITLDEWKALPGNANKTKETYMFETIPGFNKAGEYHPYQGIDKIRTISFENVKSFGGPPKYSTIHVGDATLGHTRYMNTTANSKTFTVLEVQSDAAQSMTSQLRQGLKNTPVSKIARQTKSLENNIEASEEALKRMKANPYNLGTTDGAHPWEISTAESRLTEMRQQLEFHKGNWANIDQKLGFYDNSFNRLFRENLNYASQNGMTTMRYPTIETTNKIQGFKKEINYTKYNVENLTKQLEKLESGAGYMIKRDPTSIQVANKKRITDLLEKYKKMQSNGEASYLLQMQSVQKKYGNFEKMVKKELGKGVEVRTVTDKKGNTWYEIDIPENYLKGTAEIKPHQYGGEVMKI